MTDAASATNGGVAGANLQQTGLLWAARPRLGEFVRRGEQKSGITRCRARSRKGSVENIERPCRCRSKGQDPTSIPAGIAATRGARHRWSVQERNSWITSTSTHSA